MHTPPARLPVLLLLSLALASVGVGPCTPPGPVDGGTIALAGLTAPGQVFTDTEGVRHILVENDHDLAFLQGWVHARDRFFEMDATRREVSGDLAELIGPSAIGSDTQNRTIGLRRAAERSEAALSAAERAFLQAYADGVNAWLANNPLPPEYTQLELTSARPWDVVDALAIGKAIAASLSLDIDAGVLEKLNEYVEAGDLGGYDGAALLSEDVRRFAPIDPVSTVPDATNGFPFVVKADPLDRTMLAKAARGAHEVREKFSRSRMLRRAMNWRETQTGSNEWGVAGPHASGGRPIIANDPHLSLNWPSTFYEVHLTVENDPDRGPLNASGVGFPGAPGVILGQTEKVTWGATTNPMDVTDLFADTLVVFTPECLAASTTGVCIETDGTLQPVEIELTQYKANRPGDGILDHVTLEPLGLDERLIITVPFRSFGPVVFVEDPDTLLGGGTTTAWVLQFTGFHATREVETFLTWNRAENLADFLDGLDDFDFGSQNWAYADADGNLGYFSSGELPLRVDLEAGFVDGLPPFMLRDGAGGNNWVPDPAHSQGQTIPFAVLPYAEMPQTLNPANGYFVNANNDPAGTTLDNDPLNQMRPGKPSAIYYLSGGYSNGLRAGRINQLVTDQIDAFGKVTPADMRRFQSNTQQRDAELMTPFLLESFDRAAAPGAPAQLAALAADAEIAEAVGRLADWDYSSPTGIPEGYDHHDVDGVRTSTVPAAERDASVAATIYNVWRAKLIKAVINARLSALGLSGVGSGDGLKAVHHLLDQMPFTGVGASGVDFFPEPAALTDAEDRRDHVLLTALRTALDALASNDFQAAFGNSTDQDDYRWGRLHRITLDHRIDPALSVPPQAGFTDLAPGLPGISRDGGYEVVNASGFSAVADGSNEFRFGGGPVRRYVGQPKGAFGPDDGPLINGWNVIPGGSSAIPGDPTYAPQLGKWLTADYHSVEMSLPPAPVQAAVVETFLPSP